MSEGIGKKTMEFFSELVIPGVLGLALILGMLWMSGFFGMFGGSAGLSNGEVDDFQRPPREAVESDPVVPNPDPGYWTCDWSPTMNEDWHDDVQCSRGFEAIRPTLLADWSYVTYEDMMGAARDYEAKLNG